MARAFRARRRTEAAAPCDTTVRWPQSTQDSCLMNSGTVVDYDFMYRLDYKTMIQICRVKTCLEIIDAMKAANPRECSAAHVQLYADMITPLEAVCRSQATTPAPSPSQSPPTPAPAPVPAPAPTPTPATPTTYTPSTAPSIAPTPAKPTVTATRGETSEPPSTTAASSPGISSAGSGTSEIPSPSKTESTSEPTTPSPTSGDSTSPPTLSPTSSSSASSSTDSSTSLTGKKSGRLPSSSDSGQIANEASVATSSSHTVMIGVVIAAALVVLLGLWFVYRHLRKKKANKVLNEQDIYTELTTTGTGSSGQSLPRHAGAPDELSVLLTPLANWRVDARELRDISLIGSGAQGAVMLVKFNDNRVLASKRLIHDQFSDKRLRALIAEVSIISTLHHPSIVTFVGVAWTSPRDLQVLLEYMSKGDLRSHLDRTPLSWTRMKVQIALAVAEGLAYVHSFSPPVVHRDLKARNILLDAKMRAKISDFGVSRFQSENATMSTGIGTSRWLAPEVITGGGKYNELCDIYSFGILLVEMDTHALPFAELGESTSEFNMLQRVARGELQPSVSSSCHPQIAPLVEKCVTTSPTDRPNALEVAFILRKIVKAF